MNAEKLIRLSYFDIGKLTNGQQLTPQMGAVAIDSLNFLMYEYARLNLGYTEIENIADEITTPNWSWRWMRYALALELADQFGVLESYMSLEQKKKVAYRGILSNTVVIRPPQLTSNVPRGSGNRGYGGCTDKFYKETDLGVLTEQGAIITTEDS